MNARAAFLSSLLLLSCGRDQTDRPGPPVFAPREEDETSPGTSDPQVGGAGGQGGSRNVEEPPQEPTDCFFQESTGLWWEIKSEVPGHLRESTWTYSWFMPEDFEKRFEGLADKGDCTAISCDTHSYISAVNATFLCDFDDWRLPTTEELLQYPGLGSSSDPFPQEEHFYWTSDIDWDDQEVVQVVYLCCGGIDAPAVKFGAGKLILVRDDGAGD